MNDTVAAVFVIGVVFAIAYVTAKILSELLPHLPLT